MTPPLKGVTPVDFAVIAAYMALMLGIGFYAMRFNRGASDYFKGGSRIHWLAAGLSSFMSGFSAWTFTGAAGLAYQHGLVAILLYVGNACTFLLGYFLFAQRWRRARIGTVMEYLVDRYDERTRQAFSWTTIFFQLFMGASMLYGLGLFIAPTCTRSGPASRTPRSRPTPWLRSPSSRAVSWGSCWPRCSAPRCRASQGC